MPPKKPRPTEPSHTSRGRRPRRALLVLLALCASLAFDSSSHAAPAQELEKQPQPQATPHVRPRRTVAPTEAPEPQPTAQPTPAPPVTTQPQPAPTPAVNAQPQSAASQTPEEVDEEEVVRVDSNLVIIPASVVDGFGRAITDLKLEDFELKIDGEVKTIGELTRAETPVHVALLFDNSYSLSAAREFEKQAAVRFFQSVVRPIDRAAIYSISTVPTLAQGMTNDVPRLVRTIERFAAPDGATALFDAVAQAANYMRPFTGRKVLVVVSDGTDTVSDTSFDDAVNRALLAECQVYVVQTRQVEDPNLHDPVSEQRMYRLTEQTGGAVFVPKSVEELNAVFTQISLDISQQYLLSYYPQDERKDKYFRFISLRVKTRPTARVRARKGFYPDAAHAQTPEGRAQSASSHVNNARPNQSTVPQTRAADASASNKRAPVKTAPARPTSASARGRLGPDGPDTEEAAKSQPAAVESVPTFTVTVSAAAPAEKTPAAPPPTAEPPQPAASGRVAGNSLFEVAENRPAETASTPAAQPTPVTAPAPAETRDEKATAEQQAAAEASKQSGGEASKPPLSGGVLNGKALRLPVPAYPHAARNSGAQGRVVVEVTIDEQGKVIEARAVSGHSFLLQAAVQAARQARFTPALLSGQPIKIRGTINYVFTLP